MTVMEKIKSKKRFLLLFLATAFSVFAFIKYNAQDTQPLKTSPSPLIMSADGLYINGLFNYGQYDYKNITNYTYGAYFKYSPPSYDELKIFIENDIPVFIVEAQVIFDVRLWVDAANYNDEYPDLNFPNKSDSYQYYVQQFGSFKEPNWNKALIDIQKVLYSFHGSQNIELMHGKIVVFKTTNLFNAEAFKTVGHIDADAGISNAIMKKESLYMAIYFDKDAKFRLVRFELSDSKYNELQSLIEKHNYK